MLYRPNTEQIKNLREKNGLSRFGLSKKAGMGGSALYRIETGTTESVHHLSAKAIAKALSCEVEDIFSPCVARTKEPSA